MSEIKFVVEPLCTDRKGVFHWSGPLEIKVGCKCPTM